MICKKVFSHAEKDRVLTGETQLQQHKRVSLTRIATNLENARVAETVGILL